MSFLPVSLLCRHKRAGHKLCGRNVQNEAKSRTFPSVAGKEISAFPRDGVKDLETAKGQPGTHPDGFPCGLRGTVLTKGAAGQSEQQIHCKPDADKCQGRSVAEHSGEGLGTGAMKIGF